MGAGSSALAGAAIGAAVGSFIPVIGTAVGAGLGALVGGVRGWMSSGAAQREAKLMGQQLVDGFTSSMNDAFDAGDIEGLAKARADAMAQHEANMKTVTHMEEYNKHVAKFEAQLARFDKQVNIYTANAGIAERMMDMGTDALNKLANEAGVNLRSKVLSFRDVLMLSGRNMTQLAGIVRAKWGELTGLITTGAMSRIEKARQEREAVAGMNAAQEAIAGGDTSAEQIDTLIEQSLLRGTAKYGEAGGAASAFSAISQDLEMGLMKNISEDAKGKIRTRLLEVIGPDQIMQDLRRGVAENPNLLTDLLGGTAGLGGLSSQELLTRISAGSAKDPFFLANLVNAGQNALLSGNYSEVQKLMGVNTGPSAIGNIGTAVGTGPADRRERFVEKTLSPAMKQYMVTNNINAPMLTPEVIRQIEAATQRAIRDQQERGGNPPTPSSLGPR
jgi:hypothetical protein